MRRSMIQCLIIASINFIGTLVISNWSCDQYLWISFLALQFYYTGHIAMNKKACFTLLFSFAVGLVWGQISNVIWHYFFGGWPPLMVLFIDAGVLIFLLSSGALLLFDRTMLGSLPATFTGLTVTVLLWGRPLPFLGQGLLGDFPLVGGMLLALGMYLYGLVLAYTMDFVYANYLKKSQRTL